jgi:hypothetical protein
MVIERADEPVLEKADLEESKKESRPGGISRKHAESSREAPKCPLFMGLGGT